MDEELSELIPILRTRSIVRHQIDHLFYNQEDPDLDPPTEASIETNHDNARFVRYKKEFQ